MKKNEEKERKKEKKGEKCRAFLVPHSK